MLLFRLVASMAYYQDSYKVYPPQEYRGLFFDQRVGQGYSDKPTVGPDNARHLYIIPLDLYTGSHK